MMNPKTIYLSDYKPSPFKIESIELEIDIQEKFTIVSSKMLIIRSADLDKKHLELDGENLKLLEIKMDGVTLGHDAYQLSNEKLVLLDPKPSSFSLEIKVELDPASNKAMEGLYQSGDQLCTQCEAEGFRKITYFIDRPDMMSKFKTKIIAPKIKYPYLLSNGNKIGSGELSGKRHWAQWEDPFNKPSYLFAMVAGDFDVARDHFITRSKRKVDLEIYVDKGNLSKTHHAMDSLRMAMKWDEETFGLEYDLDIYMIVAVDSFNMGAMENKGLNVFNSSFVLASQETGTDHDFQNIQAVIGHEYFHNWTGNRVTCRDWFQLTLKEGLTVFRDQEFSSDLLSRAVKRLEDVKLMKESQFAEDAGPLSHPIRPNKYIEINNFYTRTVYEKGAEVIRMIHTLIGKDHFRKGMDKYFELYDGMAVTTEDFIHAMELASGVSLSQFKNWYSRPGTPTLEIKSSQIPGELKLSIEQKYPPTTWPVPEGNILHMPFRIGLISNDGSQESHLIELKKLKEDFSFKTKSSVIVSLNRGFSSPVHVKYDYSLADLTQLMRFDQDPYSRYEATQKVYQNIIRDELEQYKKDQTISTSLPNDFISALEVLISDEKIDYSFKSYLLELPSESTIAQDLLTPDFDGIHIVLKNLKKKMGIHFSDLFEKDYIKLSEIQKFELTPKAFGERALKNKILSYLVASESNQGLKFLREHYKNATNMTEEIYGLALYVSSGANLEHSAVMKFYHKWHKESLVIQKWFGTLAAMAPKNEIMHLLTRLEADVCFQKEVPNFLRALYGQFARGNLVAFHALDGSGYKFMAQRIKQIDSYNPQVASRLASSFSLMDRLDLERKKLMSENLNLLMSAPLSRDTFEVVSKYLKG